MYAKKKRNGWRTSSAPIFQFPKSKWMNAHWCVCACVCKCTAYLCSFAKLANGMDNVVACMHKFQQPKNDEWKSHITMMVTTSTDFQLANKLCIAHSTECQKGYYWCLQKCYIFTKLPAGIHFMQWVNLFLHLPAFVVLWTIVSFTGSGVELSYSLFFQLLAISLLWKKNTK